jgi:hypothetical protein
MADSANPAIINFLMLLPPHFGDYTRLVLMLAISHASRNSRTVAGPVENRPGERPGLRQRLRRGVVRTLSTGITSPCRGEVGPLTRCVSGPGGGGGRAAEPAWVSCAVRPSPHPARPSAVRPFPSGGGCPAATRLVGLRRSLASVPRTSRYPYRRRCTAWQGLSWRCAFPFHRAASPAPARRRRRSDARARSRRR